MSGSAAQAQQTFGVTIHRYLDANGREFYANANAPTLAGLIVDTAAGSGSWTLGSPSCLT